jgi:hypothetical protein
MDLSRKQDYAFTASNASIYPLSSENLSRMTLFFQYVNIIDLPIPLCYTFYIFK